MRGLKMVISLVHSDGVSGTTIFNDGMKAFWTEGPSSTIVWLTPGDGVLMESSDLSNEEDMYFPEHYKMLNEGGAPVDRDMTHEEEMEHYAARNYWREREPRR